MKQMKWMAHIVCAFILILSLAVPAVAGKKKTSHKKKPAPNRQPNRENSIPDTDESGLTSEMLKYLGVGYRPGGSTPRGVDCSGYVGLVYRNAYGLELPHQSRSLYSYSDFEKISLDDLQTGDLLFFTSSKRSKRINHVGIYLSQGEFIHAATGKGVTISNLDDRHWSERIAGARRVPEHQSKWGGRANSASNPVFSFEPAGFYIGPQDPRDLLYLGNIPEKDFTVYSMGLEIGRSQGLALSIFQDSLFSSSRADSDDPFVHESVALAERLVPASVKGVRLEKDIRPVDWLCITPSLSYFHYEGDLDITGLPKRSVGVDVALGSEKEGWKLSSGFRYLSLMPQRGFSDDYRSPDGFDMSLIYSKKVTNSLSISLIGERRQRYEFTDPDLTQQERTFDDQRFSVLFNFFY